MRLITIAACVFMSFLACTPQQQEESVEAAHLGIVTFTPTCNEDGARHFGEGLLLLHSFEYQDARTEFQKAKAADPDCVMAYWGEAMTYNHPLWAAQYTDEGREALESLADTPEAREAKAQTPLEKDFIAAVNVLYGDGEKLDRDKLYNEYMKDMYDRYKGNQEVATFYALSLLGSSVERNEATYEQGAVVVNSVLKENPEHPGALHYLIHAYDDPGHAHLALEAADAYSVIAPDAGHALHMPSHIYIALGMWDEVISSNIASWNANVVRKEKLDLTNDALNYHALQWLMYGLLQQSRVDTARTLVDNMILYTEEKPSERARAYMISMRAGYLAETSDWGNELVNLEIDHSDLNLIFPTTNLFVDGMAAYSAGDAEELGNIISQMQTKRAEEEKRLMQRGAAMCSGVGWATQLPTQQDVNFAHIMELELSALLADHNGNLEEAESLFKEATDIEDNTAFAFGPPIVVKPSHELFGEWLFRQERFEDAAKQFERQLEMAPGRNISTRALKVAQNRAASVL